MTEAHEGARAQDDEEPEERGDEPSSTEDEPSPGEDDGSSDEVLPPADEVLPPADGRPLPDVAALEHQRDEYLGALQRLQADFENYRKRVQRQQDDVTARAALRLVKVLLPTLDALDLARAHLAKAPGPDGEPELSSDAQALVQARALLLGSLEKEGLERLDTSEVPFDPAVHDAVAHAPDSANDEADDLYDGEDGPDAGERAGPWRGPVVDEVLRAGYRWQGQTVRPAMVRVRG